MMALKGLLKSIATRLFKVQTRNLEYVQTPSTRTLIAANHESFLDGVLLWLYLPVDAVYVVHSDIANHWFYRKLLRGIPHLAVSPSSPLAMKQVIRLIEKGKPVVIFPEGRITVTGALMKVYDGSAFIAAKTQATVVPVRIEGAGHSLFSRLGGVLPRRLFPKISLTVQPPTEIVVGTEGSARVRRRKAGEAMGRVLQETAVLSQPDETLFAAVLRARERFGGSTAILEDASNLEDPNLPVVTYDALLRKALAITRLTENCTQVGEHVGVLMPNASATASIILGLSAAGRVPAMMNFTAGKEGLQAACVAAQVRTILTSRVFLAKAKLESVVRQLENVRIIYAEDFKHQLTWRDKLWVLRAQRHPQQYFPAGKATDPAVVLFTSGSEGKPKGVVHSHQSILANAGQVRAMADFTPQDKFMVCLPLFHSFGFTCGMILPLTSGYRTLLFPNPLHRSIPEIVYDRNCTVLFGTSTFLGQYARNAHPYDFARVRYVVAGAEKLSETVRSTWVEKFGIRILEGYGTTETAPVIAVNTRMASRLGSVGKMVPLLQHRLEKVPGVPEGGLLLVKGPNVMSGYLRYEAPGVLEAPAHNGELGWYSTGDIVKVDDDGFVFILGRVKRFAKIGGEMVSLEAVERLARNIAPDHAHAVVAIPREGKGEALVLFTLCAELNAKALLVEAQRLGLPELAVPRSIRVIQHMPVLGTGKTDYVTLQKWAVNG